MRVFIAIDIDENIKTGMIELQKQLAEKADIKKSDVKWVKPQAMHITLKFLGEIKDQQVSEVCSIVENVANRHKSFELDIEAVGCFGGTSARVLWIGCGKGAEQLRNIQSDIEENLSTRGWPEEKRKFTGHLTLCRIRNRKAGIKLAQEFKDAKLGTTAVDALTVYQSQLTPEGPIYTRLGNYKLS